VTSRNDTSSSEGKARLNRIHHVRVRDRIYLIQANYLRESVELHFCASAYDVQVSDPDMIPEDQFTHANDYIQMPNLYILFYAAFPRINDTKANLNTLADMVTEQQPIAWPHEKRRE